MTAIDRAGVGHLAEAIHFHSTCHGHRSGKFACDFAKTIHFHSFPFISFHFHSFPFMPFGMRPPESEASDGI